MSDSGINLVQMLLGVAGAICLMLSVVAYAIRELEDEAILFALYAMCGFLVAALIK